MTDFSHRTPVNVQSRTGNAKTLKAQDQESTITSIYGIQFMFYSENEEIKIA